MEDKFSFGDVIGNAYRCQFVSKARFPYAIAERCDSHSHVPNCGKACAINFLKSSESIDVQSNVE